MSDFETISNVMKTVPWHELSKHFPHGEMYVRGTAYMESLSNDFVLVFKVHVYHPENHDVTSHCVGIFPDIETGLSFRITGKNLNGVKDTILEDFIYATSKIRSL